MYLNKITFRDHFLQRRIPWIARPRNTIEPKDTNTCMIVKIMLFCCEGLRSKFQFSCKSPVHVGTENNSKIFLTKIEKHLYTTLYTSLAAHSDFLASLHFPQRSWLRILDIANMINNLLGIFLRFSTLSKSPRLRSHRPKPE